MKLKMKIVFYPSFFCYTEKVMIIVLSLEVFQCRLPFCLLV